MMELTKTTKILLIAVLVLSAATGIAGFAYFSLASKKVEVPNFIGKEKKDVEAWALENKIASKQLAYNYSFDENSEEDTVLSQSLEANSVLKKNDVLTIGLSSGPDPDLTVAFPDFTGQEQQKVETWFQDNHFTDVAYAFMPDEKIAKNIFLKASVKAGDSVKRSDALTVTFSFGSKNAEAAVTVPDFSTYSQKNIQAWGVTNRVTVQFSFEGSEKIAKGKVISQSVKAGTTVKAGSKITVAISSGRLVSVSNFIGKSKAAAEDWIKKNGLKANYLEKYSSKEAGVILEQNPSSQTLAEGGTVVFTVSVGKVNLANYTDKKKDDFLNYIRSLNTGYNGSANIKVDLGERESDKPVGTILSQSVSGKVDPGTSVKVVVAVGKKVNVVNKAGSTLEAFKKYIGDSGLKVGTITYAYSDTVANGCLLSNDTGTYTAGSTVNCVVSKGTYVWNPGGLIKAGARWQTLYDQSAEARKYGYTVTKTDVPSEQEEGTIVNDCQVTAGGKSIACQVAVPIMITVPDVKGQDKDAAQATLTGLGLTVQMLENSDYSEQPAGQVIGQSIAANTSVRKGTAITLTYSKGPKPIVTKAVPKIYAAFYDGESAEKIISGVTQLLNSAGFYNLNFVAEDTTNTSNKKGIKSVTPETGTVINVEDTVTIVYYTSRN